MAGLVGLSLGHITPASATASTYTVLAGGGQSGISVETFRPAAIVINAGDSIKFSNPYPEIHTVTFPQGAKDLDLIIPAPNQLAGTSPPKLIFNPKVANPTTSKTFDGSAYANSGILEPFKDWTLTFSKAGSYSYLCILHPGMDGTVTVLDAGLYVPTQAQNDATARSSLQADLAKGEASAARNSTAARRANTDGTSTWTINQAASAGQADIMRFTPSRLSIGAGDMVTWSNNTAVPHTVSFMSAGGKAPDLVLPEFGPGGPGSGPPTALAINPAVLFPSRTPQAYDGSSYYNSGFLGTGPEATAGTSFSLRFDRPGTYTYICILHVDQGMAGVIEVGAPGSGGAPSASVPPGQGTAGVTLRPPATGDGGLRGSTAAAWPLALAVAFVGIATLGVVRASARL